MEDFYCYNPTKVIFGRGAIGRMGREIPAGARVLVLQGNGSIFKNQVHGQVAAALARFETAHFAGIQPNPTVDVCLRAVAAAREHRADFLLAVGGGSVIDATKFVALAFHHTASQDPWDFVSRKLPPPGQALPLGCVLTVPGTGSEMNSAFVVSHPDTQEKRPFSSMLTFPRFSALDPEATFTVSREQTANGIVDMFVHVLEQYVTTAEDAPLQDRQAEALLLTILETAPRVLEDPTGYQARATLMWCSTQALNGNISRGVSSHADFHAHTVGHELTAFFGIAHGPSLALTLPGVWQVFLGEKERKLAHCGRRVFGLQGDDPRVAREAVAHTRRFFESLGVPTRLEGHGLDAATVEARVLPRFPAAASFRGGLTQAQVSAILRVAAVGP